jgi:hypothetical protein
MREHPLSGEPVEWTWSRNYGCNTPMASEHLLTFRSGAAGYFDFCNDGGTGNFGGFRSSCTNNLIVAGGLSPPRTTPAPASAAIRTRRRWPWCRCRRWRRGRRSARRRPKTAGAAAGAQPRRAGRPQGGRRHLVAGVPQRRRGVAGGEIKLEPKQPEWFRRHSSQVDGAGLSWVAASGAKGLTSLKIELAPSDRQQLRRYTVRLHFRRAGSSGGQGASFFALRRRRRSRRVVNHAA